jgi:hypothetical protein
MSGPDVMFPEEQEQIANVCQRLHRDANAKAVLDETASPVPTPVTWPSWT